MVPVHMKPCHPGRLFADRRGVAAVEFALVVPVLIVLFFLTIEFWQAIDANRKVSRIASQVGDLVTQAETTTTDDLDAIMKIGSAILQPYKRSEPTITVTAIQITTEQAPRAIVVWSRRLENGGYGRGEPPGTIVTPQVPPSLIVPGAFLVHSEAELPYHPMLAWSESQKRRLGLTAAFDTLDMGENYYLRPRRSDFIPCSDC